MKEEAGEIQQESTESNKYADFDDIDKAIIQFKVNEPGITNTEISKRLKINRGTVISHLQKVKVAAYLEDIRKSALDILLETQAAAAKRLRQEVKNPSADIAIKACKEILKGVLSENYNVNVRHGKIARLLAEMSDEDIAQIEEDVE